MSDTTTLLNSLVEKKNITAQDAAAFLDDVMEGNVSPVQAGAILTALRMKGETADEILGFVQAMRARMLTVKAEGAIDIVGTGGDEVGPFNISTASAFAAAGAGAKVAKHGNRSASSKCGSADVLEALGVNIHLTPDEAQKVIERTGIVFLFAPLFHPATKQVVAVRKELKIRTIFNVLGPLLNPAGVKRQLLGAANAAVGKKIADVAALLGYDHLLVVSSEDGMDKISLSAKTKAFDITGRKVKAFTIDPKKFGFKAGTKKDILGGTADENAQIIRDILAGKKGPKRDIVVLNTAFALYVAGIAKTPYDGIALAEKSIDSGEARKALERLVEETNAFPKPV